MKNEKQEWKSICGFTTGKAVENGTLILMDENVCLEALLSHPVYVTSDVFSKYIQVPAMYKGHHEESDRLWLLLFMLTGKSVNSDKALLTFKFPCMLPDEEKLEKNEKRISNMTNHREITLKAVVQGRDFDDPSPAIFIMKPN